jgi:hypothetical protein
MNRSELVPIQVYELLLVYKVLDEQLVMKFCYQSISDHQAVRDALDHVNEVSERMNMMTSSLEVFCIDMGFRGLDPEEPNIITNKCDRQIYDSDDLDTSLIEELPLRMEAEVTR